jgi:molybdopterin-guanine dinucleotide biosynthesis protein A
MKPADLSSLSGVVLCGGESRRMGRDKGLLPIGDTCWAIHMAGKLASWKIPVFYSINAGQQANYGILIPSGRLIVDALGIPGPLEGLFSVHRRLPGRDLLLLACDMPDLDEATIRGIVDVYREGGPYDFYVYQEEGAGRPVAQPFCGIYTSAGLDAFWSLFAGGEGRGDHSLQSLLNKGRTRRLPIERGDVFRNYNSL